MDVVMEDDAGITEEEFEQLLDRYREFLELEVCDLG